MIQPMTGLAAALGLLVVLPAAPTLAQEYGTRADRPGVILSTREQRVSYPVRLPDGRVVRQTGSGGIPWLFGIGDVYGKASALPLVNGATPSVMASTPSGGIVPGQDPR